MPASRINVKKTYSIYDAIKLKTDNEKISPRTKNKLNACFEHLYPKNSATNWKTASKDIKNSRNVVSLMREGKAKADMTSLLNGLENRIEPGKSHKRERLAEMRELTETGQVEIIRMDPPPPAYRRILKETAPPTYEQATSKLDASMATEQANTIAPEQR